MLPKFIRRMRKRGGYGNHFMQRFGVYDNDTLQRLRKRRRIWVHAVSVGEVNLAATLITELRKIQPDIGVVLSTTTSTGFAQACTVAGPNDVPIYFPVDLPVFVELALKAVQPLALVLTESEIWPNAICMAAKKNIPIAVFNGRLSDSSYRGYRRIAPLLRHVLARITVIMAQSEEDAGRFAELGGRTIKVMNSAKFDTTTDEQPDTKAVDAVLSQCGMNTCDLLLVGGSTWPGEERILAEIRADLARETALRVGLVLVPRHMERRHEVAAELSALQCSFALKSELGADQRECDILVADTTGELRAFYARADAVFVGKSMAGHSEGQNIVEPAALGKPVAVGPGTANFKEITRLLVDDQAIVQTPSREALHSLLLRWIREPDQRIEQGRRARKAVQIRQGASRESAATVLGLLPPAGEA